MSTARSENAMQASTNFLRAAWKGAASALMSGTSPSERPKIGMVMACRCTVLGKQGRFRSHPEVHDGVRDVVAQVQLRTGDEIHRHRVAVSTRQSRVHVA